LENFDYYKHASVDDFLPIYNEVEYHVPHENIDMHRIASALNYADEDEDREEGIQNLRLAVLEKYFGNTDLPLDVPYEECEEEPEIGQKRMRPQYSILPLKSMKHEEEEEISYYEPNDEE
jgi:hypothetical protein